MLVRHKEYGLVWIFVATMLSILAFFAGTSLEYAPAIIVMELASILALRAVCQNRLKTLPYLFFFVGIAVNFVDFLTCETITLTIPLLLVLWLRRHKKMSIISFEKVLRLALFWLAGYVLMWLAKWGISLLTLGGEALGALGEQMGMRSFKTEAGLSLFGMLSFSFQKNFPSLFPFCLGSNISIVTLIVLVISLISRIEPHLRKINKAWLASVIMVGAIPVLRSLIMIEHGAKHYFFTYRALGAIVMAILMIIAWRSSAKRR
jgi:hypothetical protein